MITNHQNDDDNKLTYASPNEAEMMRFTHMRSLLYQSRRMGVQNTGMRQDRSRKIADNADEISPRRIGNRIIIP